MNILVKYFSFDSAVIFGIEIESRTWSKSFFSKLKLAKEFLRVSESSFVPITVRTHSIETRIWVGWCVLDWYTLGLFTGTDLICKIKRETLCFRVAISPTGT